MFYLIPPKGFSNLSTLECDINTRFKFLQKIMDAKGDAFKIKEDLVKCPRFCSNLDCLIEGSRRDCASHFIFRLACLGSGQMQSYWIKSETELFLFRTKSEENLHEALTALLSDIKKVFSSQYLEEKHEQLLKQIYLLLRPVVHDSGIIFCKKREAFCHFIEVPWTLVEEFVARREVHIQKGIAKVPCSLFLNLLAALFKILLYNGVKQLKKFNPPIDDIRIIHLMKTIQLHFLKSHKHSRQKRVMLILTHEDVEKEVRYFPMCMQQLHVQLRQSGRLNHHERFRYSLFLKDIGLPLEENILFWKQHYSEAPKSSHSGCQHIWTSSTGKRFEYGLRHLYGKEGKRVEYSSHSCSSLQALNPQPQERGGCPFTNLERNSLMDVISKNDRISQVQLEAILRASKNNPSYACGLYLSGDLHKHQKMHQPALFSYQFSAKSGGSFRKSFSSFSSSKDTCFLEKKNWCSECRFSVINPEMSFMSPYVYYHLRKKIKNSKNKNQRKNLQILSTS